MLTLLLFVAQQLPDIVITGKRLAEVQAACIRGECTPLRDAQASIAVAESQFRDGAYVAAKRTLGDAVARNRKHAATAPNAVAALYEAYATVLLHEGDRQLYRQAVQGRVRTLRDNLPPDDPAVVAATPALGDMWIKLGDYRQADLAFRSVERDALRSGRDRAAMLATMKRVWLAAALGEPARALRMLAELESRPIASDPPVAMALRILRLRIGARDADDAGMTALVGQIRNDRTVDPVLVWAPPYELDAVSAANAEARRFGCADAVKTASSDVAGVQWVDVGFWIRPDGRTAEAEVLRGSVPRSWAPAILAQIQGRRYTAVPAKPDEAGIAGVYRVERVTRGAEYATVSGTLVRKRTTAAGFETLDLTAEPTPIPR